MTLEKKLNKVYASIIAIMFIAVAISSVFAVRTITNTNDNIDTFICDSSGNYYTSTQANIQTAIYAVDNSTDGTNGWVQLPKGTIYLSSSLRLSNHTILRGSGMGSTILKAAAGMAADMVVAWDTGTTKPRTNLTIQDLTIEGNTTASEGIFIVTVKNFIIRNVETRNTVASGILIGGASSANKGCSRGLVENCYAYHFDTGVTYSNQGFSITNVNHSIFSNLRAENGGGWGLDIHTCRYNTFTNILVKNCSYGIKLFGDAGQWGGNNVLSNINILNSSYSSGTALLLSREYNTTLANINLHKGLGRGLAIDGCEYITITGLQIEAFSSNGIKMYDDISDPSHITISNGYVRNYATSIAAFRAEDCNNLTLSNMEFYGAKNDQLLLRTRDVQVVGCRFLSSSTHGVFLQDSDYVSFTACDFIGCVSNGICSATTLSTNWSAVNCRFLNNGRGIWIDTADSNVTIMGCLFRGNGDGVESDMGDGLILMCNNMYGDSFDDNSAGRNNINGTSYNLGYVKI